MSKVLVDVVVQVVVEEDSTPRAIRATIGSMCVYSRCSPQHEACEEALSAIGDELRRRLNEGRMKP